jgi:hypothetical protein
MNTITFPRCVLAVSLVLLLLGPGGRLATSAPDKKPAPKEKKKSKIGPNVYLEVEKGENGKRRVLLESFVCLRRGMLEQLLTRKGTKQHEAILAVDADARHIHAALLAAGAKVGSTMKYKKEGDKIVIVPPTGTTIKVTLQYTDKKTKKLVTVRAQEWIRRIKTQKALAHDWVFAGSAFFKDPLNPGKVIYGANDGDVITVANFETALLDLPVASSKSNDDLAYEANTNKIPPLETKVTIILEPVLKNEKKKQKAVVKPR